MTKVDGTCNITDDYYSEIGSSTTISGGTLNMIAWNVQNSNKRTQQVGQKKANQFGLFDMSGNVREWCSDWYSFYYYDSSPENNPNNSKKTKYKSMRGGSWDNSEFACRIAMRYKTFPYMSDTYTGFRLCIPDK